MCASSLSFYDVVLFLIVKSSHIVFFLRLLLFNHLGNCCLIAYAALLLHYHHHQPKPAMDAWAKSQRRPLPGSGPAVTSSNTLSSSSSSNTDNNYNNPATTLNNKKEHTTTTTNNNNNNNNHQNQLQLHPQQQLTSIQRLNQQQLPFGAAAQRAHRIHTSLVNMYKATHDPHLAPSTISYNAAINAWSKSYHPSAGEMAELLLGEMMREWRFGDGGGLGTEEEEEFRLSNRRVEEEEEELDDDETEVEEIEEKPKGKLYRGNERVKPDVVTFTAV